MNRTLSIVAIAAACVATPFAGAIAQDGHDMQDHHGGQVFWYAEGDRLEYQSGDEDRIVFDGQAWVGGDINRLWIKAETEYLPDEDEFEGAEVEALWSRALSSYFDVQAGIRQDFEPDGETYGVIGFQGLAPYRFEIDSAAYLSTEGDLTVNMEAEYELLLTQRLILQPRAEMLLAAQDVEARQIGAGLSSAELGLRLRYEIVREFAPYAGVNWARSFGKTADYAEADGGDAEETSIVAGVRFWF